MATPAGRTTYFQPSPQTGMPRGTAAHPPRNGFNRSTALGSSQPQTPSSAAPPPPVDENINAIRRKIFKAAAPNPAPPKPIKAKKDEAVKRPKSDFVKERKLRRALDKTLVSTADKLNSLSTLPSRCVQKLALAAEKAFDWAVASPLQKVSNTLRKMGDRPIKEISLTFNCVLLDELQNGLAEVEALDNIDSRIEKVTINLKATNQNLITRLNSRTDETLANIGTHVRRLQLNNIKGDYFKTDDDAKRVFLQHWAMPKKQEKYQITLERRAYLPRLTILSTEDLSPQKIDTIKRHISYAGNHVSIGKFEYITVGDSNALHYNKLNISSVNLPPYQEYAFTHIREEGLSPERLSELKKRMKVEYAALRNLNFKYDKGLKGAVGF